MPKIKPITPSMIAVFTDKPPAPAVNVGGGGDFVLVEGLVEFVVGVIVVVVDVVLI
jgi:hypothetical protein